MNHFYIRSTKAHLSSLNELLKKKLRYSYSYSCIPIQWRYTCECNCLLIGIQCRCLWGPNSRWAPCVNTAGDPLEQDAEVSVGVMVIGTQGHKNAGVRRRNICMTKSPTGGMKVWGCSVKSTWTSSGWFRILSMRKCVCFSELMSRSINQVI